MQGKLHRYVVGTRDTSDKFRAVRVDATSASSAKEIAVRRSEDVGLYVRAVSARRVNSLGQFVSC